MCDSLSYKDIEGRFEPDGSWRDIYAFQTTHSEWSALLEALLASRWHTELRVNGEISTDIDRAVRVFYSEANHADLVVSLPDATLNCHFFTDSEIEFDLDPSEIGPANFDTLCEFAALVSSATTRNVFITEENSPEYGIFACLAATRELLLLSRPQRRTPLGASVRLQVRDVLRPFEHLESRGHVSPHESLPDPTIAPDASVAAQRFISSVYQPDSLEWHTGLTAAEYRALNELETAFGIFFSSVSVKELCRIGGFKVPALRRQFWDSVAKARNAFSCEPAEDQP